MKGAQAWGGVLEVLEEYPGIRWHCICSASFEDRGSYIPSRLNESNCLDSLSILKIFPPSDAGGRAECVQRIEDCAKVLCGLPAASVFEMDLLGGMSPILKVVEYAREFGSVVLDITSMPKRFFMFLVVKLLDEPLIKNLVVTYTKPESYPEGPLATDPEPVAALPGFGRISSSSSSSSLMIVGVGYIQFSLAELFEQSKGRRLKFLMPFPPGAPSARRNWTLLHHMDPDVEMVRDIRRIHAMDMFEAYEWINECIDEAEGGAVDLIPLGPKPHSMAMALSHRRRSSQTQVQYAQPHTYRSDYSSGIATNFLGEVECIGYCLKISGEECI